MPDEPANPTAAVTAPPGVDEPSQLPAAELLTAEDVVLQWEDLREQGCLATAEELCTAAPHLLDEVRRRIAALLRMDAALGGTDGDGSSGGSRGPGGVAARGDHHSSAAGRPRGSPPVDGSGGHGAVDRWTAPGTRYRVRKFHAAGGLGEVYIAEDEELAREVAVKRLKPARRRDQLALDRFCTEAEIAGRLEHPGMVPVYGFCRDADGIPLLAMRFVKGPTLEQAIRELHGRTGLRAAADPAGDPTQQVARPAAADPEPAGGIDPASEGVAGMPGLLVPPWARGRAAGLRHLVQRLVAVCYAAAYAHGRGIVHADIKPANILLGRYGETLLVDWGLAKPCGRGPGDRAGAESTLRLRRMRNPDNPREILPFGVVGTPGYMSPEQARGEYVDLQPASDIFSLGAVLYSILTGRAPLAEERMARRLERLGAGDVPAPSTLRPGNPPELEAICAKAMAPRARERYRDALALAADLESWLADEPVGVLPEDTSARLRRAVRRSPGRALAMLAVAAGLAVAGWAAAIAAWLR